tara:strand:+ start:15468 stop:16349 length:882 start_codon:yes stop_codon:yes gene_type:complete
MDINWLNWPEKIPKLLYEKNVSDWSNIFQEFYINNLLDNPKKLLTNKDQIMENLKSVTYIQSIYKKVLTYIKNNIDKHPDPDEILNIINNSQLSNNIFLYTVNFCYKSSIIPILPLIPYYFGIGVKKNKWISICSNEKIPTLFEIVWNRTVFSELQIKLSPNSNFTLDIDPFFIKNKIVRDNDILIYHFTQDNDILDSVINIKIKPIPHDHNKNIVGDISIWFQNISDVYNKNCANSYLKTIENSLHDFDILEQNINKDLINIEQDIHQYKILFQQKIRNIQKNDTKVTPNYK